MKVLDLYCSADHLQVGRVAEPSADSWRMTAVTHVWEMQDAPGACGQHSLLPGQPMETSRCRKVQTWMTSLPQKLYHRSSSMCSP